MELKEYQQQALNRLKEYLDALEAASITKLRLQQEHIDVHFDVFEQAWLKATGKKDYKVRKNGLGEPVPQVCFKVPTGGGKTLLATKAIDLIKTHYLKRSSTLVLWIVPSEAIYRQTLSALRNREHPYRQILDKTSGGRTLILEKTDRFTPTQLQEHLIVMLLMLPSASRRNKETLRMFQDTSGFEDFFPPEDDVLANKNLVARVPNLTYYGDMGGAIITSLGNTLRLLKPIMIIDEGHKTYSNVSQDTIRSFNPTFILELSATPTEASNVLYVVTGRDLNRENMIKLDLNVINLPSLDWKDTLTAAIKKLNTLQEKADEYRFNGGRYIRPICLIQVERTGRDQRGGNFIHAEEAKIELIKRGIDPSSIAIKSSENDGLENVDLMSEDCPIRFIITRQALQEGWDCPFAYILTVLTNPSSQTAITQLVGRVLRQPYAKKTRIKELDESYVFCFKRKARDLLEAIRRGFDEEGLSDLSHRAFIYEEDTSEVEVPMRPEFQKFAGKIYLPRFVFKEGDEIRLLSYEMDILSRVDWSKVNVADLVSVPGFFPQQITISKVNVAERVEIVTEVAGETQDVKLHIDPTFVALQISDIVSNPWMAYQIAKRTLDVMIAQHGYEAVATDLGLIINALKIRLMRERDEQCRAIFHDLVQKNTILFLLDIGFGYILPNSIKVRSTSRHLVRDNNTPLQTSLFEVVPEEDLNPDEQEVAVYLDKQEQFILWWDRNFARVEYFVQGWEKERIYPDFLIGRRDPNKEGEYDKILVLETKGRHLENPETEYKRSVFQLCNELAKEWDTELEDARDNKHVEFHLVFHDEAKSKINAVIQQP
ncbi:MAG TPA: DEAD/DEAH box helicase family protein [Ktedonobacteraceae bacterium]|jgi:type III restriction enzyme|nr:DEAD/DEAH box helicase family protein [Ktedonobacteraceae bacterium]